MSAKRFNYYDDWKNAVLTCDRCGWSGRSDEGTKRYFRELFDVLCPRCTPGLEEPDQMLAIVSYPSLAEIQAAADAGDLDAKRNLEIEAHRQARWARFEKERLASPDQLPDIEGEALDFILDAGASPGPETVNKISVEGRVIWQELAWWENHKRFEELREILKQKYGSRFRSLKVTRAAEEWLFGDLFTPPFRVEIVERLDAAKADRPPEPWRLGLNRPLRPPLHILLGPRIIDRAIHRLVADPPNAVVQTWHEGAWWEGGNSVEVLEGSPPRSSEQLRALGLPPSEIQEGICEDFARHPGALPEPRRQAISDSPTVKVLVGPCEVKRRICRIVLTRDGKAVREDWFSDRWLRTGGFLSEVLAAPSATEATLDRRGVPASDRPSPRARTTGNTQ